MSRLLLLVAVAGLLMASVALASHLETVFSLSLPYPEYSFATQGAVVKGDGLYISCGIGSTVEAVNLTTQTNMWVSPNLTAYGYIYGIAPTSQAVLVSFGDYIVALSPLTGQQMWAQSGYYFQFPAAAYSYGNTIYAQVVLPTGYYALQAFDVATGTPGFFQYSNDLTIDGNTAFVTQYNINGGMIVDSTLSAVDIPTNTTMWTVACSDQAAGRLIPAISSQYVAISNLTSGDEVAVVLHRKNGTVAQSFQAFNGFANFGVAAIHGNTLFALIGYQYPRYVLADLTTGYITWTRSEGEVGSGGVVSGGALVAISYSLVLSITPLGSNSPAISIPQVPSLPSPTIVDFGYGLVQVGNLQGYTLWDTNTGDFVGSNEQDPNGGTSAPLKWNGLSLMIAGNVVTAMKVVA